MKIPWLVAVPSFSIPHPPCLMCLVYVPRIAPAVESAKAEEIRCPGSGWDLNFFMDSHSPG